MPTTHLSTRHLEGYAPRPLCGPRKEGDRLTDRVPESTCAACVKKVVR